MLTNRRNVWFRVSIVINVAVLLYAAVQLSSGPGEEWPVMASGGGADNSDRTYVRYMRELNEQRNDTPTAYASVANHLLDVSTSQKTPSTITTTNKTTSSTMSIIELEKQTSRKLGPSIIPSEPGNASEGTVGDGLDQVDQDALSEATLARLQRLLACNERDFVQRTYQRGDYWVLQNYVRADHGTVACYETVTYTTHAGYEFLDNVEPLVARWMAPISIAVHAPGSDLTPTVDSIRYLRDCSDNELVRQYVTFHVFFSHKHVPSKIPVPDTFLQVPYNCSNKAPYMNVNSNSTYLKTHNMLYPVNVARNIARDAALTHFILPSDIELYPSPNLVPQFLNMIARNKAPLTGTKPRVFPISIFEIDGKHEVPSTKTQLQAMLAKKTAIPFHKFVCPNCHNIPQAVQWIHANETGQMDVFHVGKRQGKFVHWEPIYIGTHQVPYYDERLSWDGKKDKMTQGYVLCVKDYDFMILNNAFLCHKPGIKKYFKNAKRDAIVSRQNSYVTKFIMPELKKLYGSKAGCAV